MTEDEMVGWHHRLSGHEFEQALGIGDEQGSLACCSSWGHKRVRHDRATELNPKLTLHPPHPQLSLGSHMSVVYACESVSVSQRSSFVSYISTYK